MCHILAFRDKKWRLSTFCDKNYHILTFCDKKLQNKTQLRHLSLSPSLPFPPSLPPISSLCPPLPRNAVPTFHQFVLPCIWVKIFISSRSKIYFSWAKNKSSGSKIFFFYAKIYSFLVKIYFFLVKIYFFLVKIYFFWVKSLSGLVCFIFLSGRLVCFMASSCLFKSTEHDPPHANVEWDLEKNWDITKMLQNMKRQKLTQLLYCAEWEHARVWAPGNI